MRIAMVYYNPEHEFRRALDLNNKALHYFTLAGDFYNIGCVWINLALVYQAIDEF